MEFARIPALRLEYFDLTLDNVVLVLSEAVLVLEYATTGVRTVPTKNAGARDGRRRVRAPSCGLSTSTSTRRLDSPGGPLSKETSADVLTTKSRYYPRFPRR